MSDPVRYVTWREAYRWLHAEGCDWLTCSFIATVWILRGMKIEAMTPPQSTQDPCREALTLFVKSVYLVSTDIDPRGHRWCEAYLDQALKAAERALAQEPATSTEHEPAGWKLVPLVPTNEMWAAWDRAPFNEDGDIERANAWAAMLAAAPQPPAASPPAKKHLGDSVGADGKRPAAAAGGIRCREQASGGGGQ